MSHRPKASFVGGAAGPNSLDGSLQHSKINGSAERGAISSNNFNKNGNKVFLNLEN